MTIESVWNDIQEKHEMAYFRGQVGIGERPLAGHYLVDDAVSLAVEDWPASVSSTFDELRSQTFEVCYFQLYAIIS